MQYSKDKDDRKKVVIIAHSMGGLVYWYWKNNVKNNASYLFDTIAVVLVGTPLQGTCAIIPQLIKGYKSSNDGTGFIDLYIKYNEENYMGQIDPAVPSFPSVYQLVPEDAEKCIKIGENFISIYEEENAEYKYIHWMKDIFDDYKDLTIGDLDDYNSRVRYAMQAGAEFRSTSPINLTPPIDDHIYYIFSAGHEIPPNYDLDISDISNLKLEPEKKCAVKSDGRVSIESAINYTNSSNSPISGYYELYETHLNLTECNGFKSFLKRMRTAIEGDMTLQIARHDKFDWKKYDINDKYIISPISIGAPTPKVLPKDDFRKNIAENNLKIVNNLASKIAKISIDDNNELKKKKKIINELKCEDKHIDDKLSVNCIKRIREIGRVLEINKEYYNAMVIYQSLNLKTDEKWAVAYKEWTGAWELQLWMLNNLGLILIQLGEFSEAIKVLEKAIGNINNNEFDSPKLAGFLYNNYGAALFHSESLGEAKVAYNTAIEKGSPKAKNGLSDAMKKLKGRQCTK